MKFDNTVTEAVIIGDIEDSNITIDMEDTDFIVSILSSKLYSKPIESFIREIVTNAYDSHVEAKVDKPIIIELGENTEGKYFCRIQDFGLGLSRENADEVYKKLGKSTKRHTNDLTGGFGVGRFAALAYSDSVYVTSNHNGVKYSYLLFKDGLKVKFNLLSEVETEEENGVEVLMYIDKNDVASFSNAILNQLPFFENLYYTSNLKSYYSEYRILRDVKTFNEGFIKKYKNFDVQNISTGGGISIRLGKIKYPLRWDEVALTDFSYLSSFPISLSFEIGELEITPNREEISYTPETIKKIQEKLVLTKEELLELIKEQSTKDYTSIKEYVKALKTSKIFTLLEDENNPVSFNFGNLLENANLTLNGEAYHNKNFLKIYEYIFNYRLFSTDYTVGNTIRSSKTRLDLNKLSANFPVSYVCDVPSLNTMGRAYLRSIQESEQQDLYIFSPKQSIRGIYKDYYRLLKKEYKIEEDFRKIVKVIFQYVLHNISFIKKFDNNSVPASFIAKVKKEAQQRRLLANKNTTDWSTNISIGYAERSSYRIITRPTTRSLKELSSNKYLTVYGEKGDPRIKALLEIYDAYRIKYAEVAPTRLKLLENIPNHVNIKDFMSTKYKLIRKIATANLLKEKLPHILDVALIKNLNKFSPKLAEVVKEMATYINTYSKRYYNSSEEAKQVIQEILDLCKDQNYYDEEMMGLYKNNKRELENSAVFLAFKNRGSYNPNIEESAENILVDYLLARRLIRPTLESVKKLRKETIFNIKEEL